MCPYRPPLPLPRQRLLFVCSYCGKKATHYVLTPNLIIHSLQKAGRNGKVALQCCKEHANDVFMRFVNYQLQIIIDAAQGVIRGSDMGSMYRGEALERLISKSCMDLKSPDKTKEGLRWQGAYALSRDEKVTLRETERYRERIMKQSKTLIKIKPLLAKDLQKGLKDLKDTNILYDVKIKGV